MKNLHPSKTNYSKQLPRFSSWWLNQPLWKNIRQNGFIFPKFRGENSKKSLKPPPRKKNTTLRIIGPSKLSILRPLLLLYRFKPSQFCCPSWLDPALPCNRPTPALALQAPEALPPSIVLEPISIHGNYTFQNGWPAVGVLKESQQKCGKWYGKFYGKWIFWCDLPEGGWLAWFGFVIESLCLIMPNL